MTLDDQDSRSRLLRRTVLSTASFFVLLAALMFLSGGIGWWRGWRFYLVFLALMVASAVYLWRTNPEIFLARSKVHAGTKAWDKPLLALILLAFLAVFLVAGLDARFGWSSVPLWLVVVGYVLFALGFVMSDWVYAVNKFAEPSVRIQSDRGQTVIDVGPYAVVRHPLYVAGGFLVAGMALALGSYFALVPVGVGILVIVVRTVLEDRLLQDELAGYKQYAARVRYRLVPGVW